MLYVVAVTSQVCVRSFNHSKAQPSLPFSIISACAPLGNLSLIECNLRLVLKKLQCAVEKVLFIYHQTIVYFFYLIVCAIQILKIHTHKIMQ